LNYLTLPIKKTDIKQNTLTHVDQQNTRLQSIINLTKDLNLNNIVRTKPKYKAISNNNIENILNKISIHNKIENTTNNFNYNFTALKNSLSTTFLCNICNKNISSSIYKYHKESHPSKIFEWLYIGGYSNAMNKEVRR